MLEIGRFDVEGKASPYPTVPNPFLRCVSSVFNTIENRAPPVQHDSARGRRLSGFIGEAYDGSGMFYAGRRNLPGRRLDFASDRRGTVHEVARASNTPRRGKGQSHSFRIDEALT